jgi:hypothetical protein
MERLGEEGAREVEMRRAGRGLYRVRNIYTRNPTFYAKSESQWSSR